MCLCCVSKGASNYQRIGQCLRPGTKKVSVAVGVLCVRCRIHSRPGRGKRVVSTNPSIFNTIEQTEDNTACRSSDMLSFKYLDNIFDSRWETLMP